MQDISDELGLLKGSLYHHIRSKEELLIDVLSASVDDVHNRVLAAARQARTPREMLRAVVVAEVLAMADHLDEISIWLAERSRMPEALAGMAQKGREVDRVLVETIEQGQLAGEWNVPDRTLAFLAIRDMTASFATWFNETGELSAEAIAHVYARYAEHVLDGENCRKRRPVPDAQAGRH